MILQRKRNSAKGARHLALENLETRQMLTVWAPWYSAAATVPQDSAGTQLFRAGYEIEEFSQPLHGKLRLASKTGGLIYTPDAGYIGADSFTYSTPFASDVTFDLTVSETVYAVPDWTRMTPGSESQVIDVLGNDYVLNLQGGMFIDSEILHLLDVAYPTVGASWTQEQSGLTIVGIGKAAHGTVSINADGRGLRYKPNAGFVGSDLVEYTVEDEFGHRSAAQLTVEVSDTPVLEGAYTSEAEFVHDRIDAWMERYAGHLGSTGTFNYARGAELDFDWVPFTANDLGNEPPEVTEGDIVKRGGDYLYVASRAQAQLSIIDMSDPTQPTLVSSVEFEQPIIEMYVDRDRLTLITEDSYGYGLSQVRMDWYGRLGSSSANLHLIDVSAPEKPQRLFSAEIEGNYRDARVIGQSMYLVGSLPRDAQLPAPRSLNSENLPMTSPSIFVDQLLDEGASAFLPRIEVQDSQGKHTANLFDWSDLRRLGDESPNVFVGTFDLSGKSGLPTDVEITRLGQDYTLPIAHFSNQSIYILGQEEIVKFDLQANSAGVEFAAEGEFQGQVLDQFSVDEYEGRVRIATTENSWSGQVDVQVLEQVDRSLQVVGSLRDIAPGEMIYSTRFDGNRAFVVTYRKVDPLFVIDLSDPTSPQVAGELKIPGFSNYMQVINADYVIGVGRNADPDSGLFQELQVSLFDVSDPSDPMLVDRFAFEGGRETWSVLVEGPRQLGDHQAFHYLEEVGILALPFHSGSRWPGRVNSNLSSAVRFFEIDVTKGIEPIGDVEFDSQALRSLQFGEYMVCMSDEELKVTDLTDPAKLHAELDLISDVPVSIDDVAMARGYDAGADLDGDGVNSPLDALMIIQQFNRTGAGRMDDIFGSASDQSAESMAKYDVNRDGVFNPIDALRVIAAMNSRPQGEPSLPLSTSPAAGESSETASRFAQYVDALFAELPQ